MIVMKFGGTSVADRAAIERLIAWRGLVRPIAAAAGHSPQTIRFQAGGGMSQVSATSRHGAIDPNEVHPISRSAGGRG